MQTQRLAAVRLFLLGFLTLFLELALIRYLSGNVWNMGYFPNLVLMGVFIGMGVGFVLHHRVPQERSHGLLRLSAFVLMLLITLVYWKHPHVPGFNEYIGTVGEEVYFTAAPEASDNLNFLFFILVFTFVIAIFSLISQRTAKFFRMFPPLTAYTLDILGSCCGILSFMLVSWLQVPPFVWFCFLIVLFCLILESARVSTAAVLGVVVLFAWLSDQSLLSNPSYSKDEFEAHWSPYQKVEFTKLPGEGNFIFVNGIGHQAILTPEVMKRSIYLLPYQYRLKENLPAPADVLVIGAGNGNDVAAALQYGAQHIDAVEIDPVIAAIGRENHPLHPYQNARVTQVIDDGRAFMTYTRRKYDVVIFAMTDSLIKVSPMSQLRLENYLFTQESVQRAYSLLKDGGTVFFYNYYRLPWVVSKIQQMAHDASGVWPQTVYRSREFSMMSLDRLHPAAKPAGIDPDLQVPRDDWPFPYLRVRSIPSLYRIAMISVTVFILLLAFLLRHTTRSLQAGEGAQERQSLVKAAFLLMGTAFLLLETKSVIQFSLLFGTTWLNNSLVFLTVLLFVLAANRAAVFLSGPRVLPVTYALLMLFCLSALFYPLGRLLAVQSLVARFVLAGILTFSPIFFANVIFSVTFRDRKLAEHLFGWNLIGAALGGVLEYSSMALGYNTLAVIVAACYTVVFLLLWMEAKNIKQPREAM